MQHKITFIGSGNVAWNLAHALDQDGHTIIQVISRSVENAKALASKFGAFYGNHLSELYNDSSLIIVTVNDDSYSSVLEELKPNANVVVCHTSGPVKMDVLEGVSRKYGVFYPLQSFNKSQLKQFKEVPLLVEGSDSQVERTLRDLAERISNRVKIVSSEDRMKYHLAAVFANNFTNLMYTFADEYVQAEGLDFEVLHPIIFDTALRVRHANPKDLQTGPARRGDEKVMSKHLEMIQDPKLKEVYERLSKMIMTLS